MHTDALAPGTMLDLVGMHFSFIWGALVVLPAVFITVPASSMGEVHAEYF